MDNDGDLDTDEADADCEVVCVPDTTECSAEAECGVELDECGDPIACGTCGPEEICADNICEDDTDPPVGDVEIALEDYRLSIWDFSDTYTDSRDNNVLEYTLIVDVKGKVTGSGTYDA